MIERYKCFKLIFLLIVSLIFASCAAQPSPHAESGQYDLSNRDFSVAGPVELNGEWRFYWKRLLEPSDLSGVVEAIDNTDNLFVMPHTWNGVFYRGSSLGGMGYAKFSLNVRLPSGMDEVELWIPNASTAYALWANGERVAESGTVGSSSDTSLPHYRIRRARVKSDNGRIALLLQVSNFHHRRGGMWKPILMGSPDQIESHDTLEVLYDLLLLGSFLALGFYNLFLFFSTPRKSAATLLLSVMFWVLALRVLVMGQMTITRLIPEFPWNLQLKIEYLSSHAIPVLMIWAIRFIAPTILNRRIVVAFSGFVLLNSTVMLVSPILSYSKIIHVYLVVVLLMLLFVAVRFTYAFFCGDRWAIPIAVSVLMMFFIIFGETTHYLEWILSRDFAPFGALISLLSSKSVNQTTVYFVSTIITLVVLFIATNMLVVTASRYALRLQKNRTLNLNREILRSQYKISDREMEILENVIQGFSNKEIGAKLFIAEGTVKNHLHKIMGKIGVKNRTELALRVRPGDFR